MFRRQLSPPLLKNTLAPSPDDKVRVLSLLITSECKANLFTQSPALHPVEAVTSVKLLLRA